MTMTEEAQTVQPLTFRAQTQIDMISALLACHGAGETFATTGVKPWSAQDPETTVKRLFSAGWLTRSNDGATRAYQYSFTDAGEAAAKEALAVWHETKIKGQFK